jgi:hypothetical protein
MSTTSQPQHRTWSEAFSSEQSRADVDYFELELQVDCLREVSQLWTTANQYNRLRLQRTYSNDLALVCSTPVCLFASMTKTAKVEFCQAFHAYGSLIAPSDSPNRAVTSSKTVFVEELIDCLKSSGVSRVVLAAVGMKSTHVSILDTLNSLLRRFATNNRGGFVDLAVNVSVTEARSIPVLQAHPVADGRLECFPMFSYLGKKAGSLLLTGAKRMTKLKLYPTVIHKLKLAIAGRAELQFPPRRLSCLKRRFANLQRCLSTLKLQRGATQQLRVEMRVPASELDVTISKHLSSKGAITAFVSSFLDVTISFLPIDDVIKQASKFLNSLQSTLTGTDRSIISSLQKQLYADCVCALGFSFPSVTKHAFLHPTNKLRNKRSFQAVPLKRASNNKAKHATTLRASRQSKSLLNHAAALATKYYEADHATLLRRKFSALTNNSIHSQLTQEAGHSAPELGSAPNQGYLEAATPPLPTMSPAPSPGLPPPDSDSTHQACSPAPAHEDIQVLESQSEPTQVLESQSEPTQALESQSEPTNVLEYQSEPTQTLGSQSEPTNVLESQSESTHAQRSVTSLPAHSGYQDSLAANEFILARISSKVVMKKHNRWKGKWVCYLKGGGIAETGLDKHELAQVILAQYGEAFENHIVCV